MDDLRNNAIEAVAAYMNDRLNTLGVPMPLGMIENFVKPKSEDLIDMLDRSFEKTVQVGKEKGYI